MNVAKLLKLAPTMIMAAVMAYAAYSIEPSAQTGLQASTTKPVTGGNRPNTIAVGGSADRKTNERATLPRGRNPFKAIATPKATRGKAAQEARVDPNLALIKALTLNATFIQGSTKYASINGRLYRQGQRLDGLGEKTTSLVIAQVTPTQVTLEADGNRYTLAYPEEFTASTGRRSTAGPSQHDGRPASPSHPASPRGSR